MQMFLVFIWIISGLLTVLAGYFAILASDWQDEPVFMLFSVFATLSGIEFIWASGLLFAAIRAVL
jgi:hypothetical protein